MQNEPNLKNTKINITAVPTKAYMKNDVFTPTQNEPKTNPISNFPLRFNQFMKNMQNEPNLLNTQMNLKPVKIKDYMKNGASAHRKNEPNSNPIEILNMLFIAFIKKISYLYKLITELDLSIRLLLIKKMSQLTVKIPAGKPANYKITIGSDILASLWPQIETDFGGLNKFVVTDENLVSAGHLKKLLAGKDIPTFVITPAGETSKNISNVTSIIEAMEKASLGRDTLVIGLGGGTVGDIAGFAAAIFKRGVPVVHIPTTTVAQADSSIGGKTGVDSSLSKNAFGAFWQPAAVYIDVATLKTLPDREYRAGLVESVKHALIADSSYFDFIEENIDPILDRQPEMLEKIADFNCRIKAAVVEADPNEKNQRRILNYGHTIGHAVEAASGYELLHGEAVAIGIIAAALIEIELGIGSQKRLKKVEKILKKLTVPVEKPKNIQKNTTLELIKRDKKAINKWPKFVLIDKIGSVHRCRKQWAVDVPQDVVEKILDIL